MMPSSSVTTMRPEEESSSRSMTWPTDSGSSGLSVESEEEMTEAWLSSELSFSEATRSREAAMG